MASCRLVRSTIMAVLLLAPVLLHSAVLVGIWQTGASKMMQPGRLRLNSTGNQPQFIGVPLDARIASHSGCSGNASGLHVVKAHLDLEEEFERRHRVLLRECNKYDLRVALPEVTWRDALKLVLPGPLTLCSIPKVASKAFWEVAQRMSDKIPRTRWSVKATAVRHPLSRLASAYRDKFLNGKPLNEYDEKWRNVTQSVEDWEKRFLKYWLPALMSEGLLERNREFNEALNKIMKAYQVYVNNYVSQTGVPLAYPTKTEEKLYGSEEMEIAYDMLFTGPHHGLVKAFMNSYNLSDLVQRFRNTSFTFNQFLHHVVWTHDMGMPDEHWMTYTETCDPCRMKFDYVLKLETIQEEVHHLFCGVLGFPVEVGFPVRHSSYGHALGHSDREYYANVSRELMHRLLTIYRHDFAVFGYSQDL